MSKKTLLISIVVALILAMSIGAQQAYRMFVKNTTSKTSDANYIYVHPDTSLEQLIKLINENNHIISEQTFRFHAELLKFKSPKTGKYRIESKESNLSLIRKLRNGEQTPVKITFNNIRTKEQLAGRLATQLMFDSISMIELLKDDAFLEQYQSTPQTIVGIFLPDTYEVFWNISPESFIKRMYSEYKQFWSASNLAKAQKLNLTPTQVSTLASIVEEETNLSYEKPTIAGLYYNRIKRGMLLQSDPTVKFAVGNFSIKRVLYKHLEMDSPYNTYMYVGIPPGPIRIPSKQGLNAVLNMEKHDYLYMCAKETLNGEHHFSKTFYKHQVHALRYQRALNQRKIFN